MIQLINSRTKACKYSTFFIWSYMVLTVLIYVCTYVRVHVCNYLIYIYICTVGTYNGNMRIAQQLESKYAKVPYTYVCVMVFD